MNSTSKLIRFRPTTSSKYLLECWTLSFTPLCLYRSTETLRQSALKLLKSNQGCLYYICDQITMQRDITVRTTRSTVNNNVHVPHILLECCKNAFAYRGPVLWNALPENIKKCETLNCFKKCVKLHVVE